jgi:oligopeptide transport system permease protein
MNRREAALPLPHQTTRAWSRFLGNSIASIAATILALGVVLLLIWPGFMHPAVARFLPPALTWSPDILSDEVNQPPDGRHWFGTDASGRDQLSRVIHGTRMSLWIGVLATGISLVIGAGYGAAAGSWGNRWDGILMRLANGLRSMPVIVLVLMLFAWLELSLDRWLQPLANTWPGVNSKFLLLCVGLGAVSWPAMAQLVRERIVTLRGSGPVEAAHVLGATPLWIWTRHILPHLWQSLLVPLLFTFPLVVFFETFMSYVGLGVPSPQASLGSILADSVASSTNNGIRWWILAFPAMMFVAIQLTFLWLGNSLRNACAP